MPASARVQAEWLRRVEAVPLGGDHAPAHALIQLAAPPAACGSWPDELRHVELSHRVHGSAGGTGAPAIARAPL